VTADRFDEVDRSIMRQLQADGRATNTQIARELGLTEAAVRKRLRRLLDEGVLSIGAMPTTQTVGDMSAVVIGITATLGSARRAAETLARHRAVSFVGLSAGRYDIIVEAFFESHGDLLTFITGDLAEIDGVRAVETSLVLEIVKFKYEWDLM